VQMRTLIEVDQGSSQSLPCLADAIWPTDFALPKHGSPKAVVLIPPESRIGRLTGQRQRCQTVQACNTSMALGAVISRMLGSEVPARQDDEIADESEDGLVEGLEPG
jgi:hypothetical protein